jgi:hypothetical protein
VPRVIRKCVTLVGAILIIMATAVGFTAYLIQASIPQLVMESMQSLMSSKWMFLLLLNVFLLFVGMLMDIFSAIIVVVPLIVPVATHFGINPYHLGAIFLLNLELGYLTPPLGLNLFLSSFRFERPMVVVYRAVAPFILVLVVCLGIVTYAPGLSTWSSRLVMPLRVGTASAETPRPTSSDEAAAHGQATSSTEPVRLDSPETLGEGELERQSDDAPTLDSLLEQAEREAAPALEPTSRDRMRPIQAPGPLH